MIPSVPMASDEQQLLQWQAGDTDAGNELVRRHFAMVYSFFRSKVELAAEDLTQKTFLACVEGHHRLRNSAGFRAYLLGIARHVLHRHLRDLTRRDNRTSPLGGSLHDNGGSPSRTLAGRDEQRVLLLVLRELPLDLQIILELYYWEDMSMEEIGYVLEIPPGTAKSRLFRGRRLAERLIDGFADTDALRRSTRSGFQGWVRSLRGQPRPREGAPAREQPPARETPSSV